MRMKSRIGDGMFITLLILSIMTLLFFVVWAVIGDWIPVLIILLVLIVVVIPVYFGTFYDIDKEALKINCGLFLINYKIQYQNIISMADSERFSLAPALSFHRICIRYVKNGKIKSILISPANKEKFRELVHAEIKKAMDKAKFTPDTADDSLILEVLEKEKIAQAKKEAKELEKQAKIAEKEKRISEKEIALLAKRAEISEKNNEIQAMKTAVQNASEEIEKKAMPDESNQPTSLTRQERRALRKQKALERKQAKAQLKLEQQNAKATALQIAQKAKLEELKLKEQAKLEQEQERRVAERQKELMQERLEQERKLNLSEEQASKIFNPSNKFADVESHFKEAKSDTKDVEIFNPEQFKQPEEKSATQSNTVEKDEKIKKVSTRGRPSGTKKVATKKEAKKVSTKKSEVVKKRGRPAGAKNNAK